MVKDIACAWHREWRDGGRVSIYRVAEQILILIARTIHHHPLYTLLPWNHFQHFLIVIYNCYLSTFIQFIIFGFGCIPEWWGSCDVLIGMSKGSENSKIHKNTTHKCIYTIIIFEDRFLRIYIYIFYTIKGAAHSSLFRITKMCNQRFSFGLTDAYQKCAITFCIWVCV